MVRDDEVRQIVARSAAIRQLFAEESLVLDVINASDITAIPPETIYRWCREKGICVRFGPLYFIGATRLLNLLSARKDKENAFLSLQAAIAVALQHEHRRSATG